MTAPILHHPAFTSISGQPEAAPMFQDTRGTLSRLTKWLDERTVSFERTLACRRNARIVSSLPTALQKDIGWRAHNCDAPEMRSRTQVVASLAPQVFFAQS